MFSDESMGTENLWPDVELLEKDLTEGYWMLSTLKWPSWYVFIENAKKGYFKGWRWGDPGP